MIVVQTPLRISFLGGGTDFRDFYKHEEGCVLSSAIDKYVYVIIKKRFDEKIRLGYTRTELVDNIDELQHELIREALRIVGVERQVEITTMGDIPAQGSGLGSSSTVTVGCLNALYTYTGHLVDAETLARQACEIEIDTLGKPIGKQDQYIAAFGGLRFIRFKSDNTVQVESVGIGEDIRCLLDERLLLFYTGITRQADSILTEQVAQISNRMSMLRELKTLAIEARSLLEQGDIDALGILMDQGWSLKKQLASKISNGDIDAMYADARRAGALGGKITGAGGGGFLLLYCPPTYRDRVRYALRGLRELPFRLERDGSKTILNAKKD
ncbi:MAG: GHMP kinase [Chloroflexi bacterium]|nr:GHMP kinase [Chloroflexota bacterium]